MLLASIQGALFGLASLAVTGRAGPPIPKEGEGGTAPTEEAEEPPLTMSWSFLAPGLPWWKRLLLLVPGLLWQPIPDEPMDEGGELVEWEPGATNLPFGPWLALAGVELMLFGPVIARWLPPELAWLFLP